MKFLFLTVFILFIGQWSFSQSFISSTQILPGISIRALEVRNDSTVWFAANKGVWGYTENGGRSWQIDSIKVDSLYPEFRSIAVLNDSTTLLLSISSPAFLFRTTDKGKTWKLVYKNEHQDIFFDSMKFWDAENGMALADPIEGKIQLINTHDGGRTWKPVTHSSIPSLEKGESFFASSNTCFDLYGNHSWIATGGMKTRVLHSPNGGRSHLMHSTPLPEGEQMTGIYSIDFFNSKIGVIGGGNYDNADTSIASIAITQNGGKDWREISFDQPVFGSCVQFLSKNEIIITGASGTFLYAIAENKLTAILDTDGYMTGYHTLRIAPGGKTVWLAGGNGSIGKINIQ